MTITTAAKSLQQGSKVLYGVIAVAALVTTWSQNGAYLHAGIGRFFTDFLSGVEVTPASRSIACDILYFFLAATIFMVIEARKHGIGFVWAVSLIARELRTGASGAPHVRAVDAVLLGGLAAAVAALTIWIDMH